MWTVVPSICRIVTIDESVKKALMFVEEDVASIDVEAKATNHVLYVAYLPVIFTYYSDPNTMSVVSVIFVPVKTIVAKYETENGERKYNDDFVTNTQNKLGTWKSSGAVIQSDSAR